MKILEDFNEFSKALKVADEYRKQGLPYLVTETLIKEYNISFPAVERVMQNTYGQLTII